MTELENKILDALKAQNERMKEYDADRKNEYDAYMEKAKNSRI